LIAEEIEAVAIAGMVDRPCFTRGLLVSAKSENDEVGFFGNFAASACERRSGPIAQCHFVVFPTGKVSVILQPFRIKDLG